MKNLNTKELNSHFKNQIRINYKLNQNSWFGIGGTASTFFQPNTKQDLKFFLNNTKSKKIFCIGSGSNILFKDQGFDGVIIKLGKGFLKIEENNFSIKAGAAALKSKVSDFAQKLGLSNFEFLSAIPGTVGGGVFMNAGCFGSEFANIVDEVIVMDFYGEEHKIKDRDILFSYRKSGIPKNFIIIEVIFKKTQMQKPELIREKINLFKEQKKTNQPGNIRTGGSTFKNPLDHNIKAWELIRKYDCDKLIFGNAKFSSHHCNFIDNSNLASSEDIEKLIKKTQEIILKKSGIKLELEIDII